VNFKKGIDIALRMGADIIVNIDGDGQFNPKDIPKLIKPILDNEADMVTCSRFINPEMTKNMPWAKKWGNKRFSNLISDITGEKFTDTQCGFRAYSREAALRLNLKGKFTYTQEVFIDLVEKGMRIKEVPCEVQYFEGRKSAISQNSFAGLVGKYGFKSLGIIAKTTRDTQPLTFFGLPALLIFGLGFLGGAYSFVYWLIEHVTTPIKTLFNVSVFFMIFGAALGVLAMVADMLKTMKTNQDEILYRLKRNEVDHASALEVLDGKMEKVNGKMEKFNGTMKKIHGNIEKVNGQVEEIKKKEEKNYVKKETKESEGIAMFKTGKITEDKHREEKKGEQERSETKGVGYYANLKAHKERMKRGY
jgi:glycosyltransferase involved in cell wall biosynthesis